VAAASAQALADLVGGERLVDLLLHLPVSYTERSHTTLLREAATHSAPTVAVTITGHQPKRYGSAQPHRIYAEDAEGNVLQLVFFRGQSGYLTGRFPVGSRHWVTGKMEWYHPCWQMAHPEAKPCKESEALPEAVIVPVYPASQAFTQARLRKLIAHGLSLVPELPEWIDGPLLRERAWPNFREALRLLHLPQPGEAPLRGQARERLAYDEILARQALLWRARREVGQVVPAIPFSPKVDTALRAALPFTLTDGQERVIREIGTDIATPNRMLRLLQGDVGSGKTVVALWAMAQTAAKGRQAALLAPTALLAKQHAATLAPIAEALGFRLALVTGQDAVADRRITGKAIRDGYFHWVIGTHALFQEKTQFQDLGLAVIDEQHRFGVRERLRLAGKGEMHLLLMTATPIPRSLTLALYGDMESSRLSEKPANRQPIDTRVMPTSRIPEVLEGITRALKEGARVYWICPLVSESETSDLMAAEERARLLEEVFPGQVGLVHGQMPGETRDRVMEAFSSGALTILVATTVIEVGVNVPEATVMVVEHAERFGLAQLHQLRGRVGRGAQASYCLLLYDEAISETGKDRLRMMRHTNDGFLIAEEDLRLRGGGDVLGLRQSGLPALRIADLSEHQALFAIAQSQCRAAETLETEAYRLNRALFAVEEQVELKGAG
jgi:ATP-dependent DNA helicase RecG